MRTEKEDRTSNAAKSTLELNDSRAGCARRLLIPKNYDTRHPDLKRFPGKTGDKRNEGFRSRHGKLFQVEVDALDPDTLREFFAAAIDEFFDKATWESVLRLEEQERAQL